MYSALADIWSGEIPEKRENAGTTAPPPPDEVTRPRKGSSYAAAVLLPKFTGGLEVRKLPAKVFSDATVSMLMDCLSA